jgi:predicted CXXCH cytochrome family protein
MSRVGRLIAILVALLLVGLDPARAADDCAQCHASLTKKKDVHPAAESCDSCHEPASTPHPQKGKHTFKLTQEPPALCFTCHEAFPSKGHVHPPVKEGACTTCHDPHASDEPKLLAGTQKELCGTCHSDHLEFKLLHGPVSAGECTACHTPHQSENKALLVKKEEQLCASCHTDAAEFLKKKRVHPALEGGCTSCHNPHGSKNPKLLADQGNAVCFTCHDDIGTKVQKAAVAHPPVASEKGCESCHSPHASENAKLLLKPEKDTCLGCHKAIVPKTAVVVHGPIQNGSCTACHEPHGSANARLLKVAFQAEPYVPYTDQSYALCFTCHKREMLQFPDTSYATGFRDGERNLHFLHVNNKQKGRSCVLCHDVHAGPNPKLIADNVPFGQWKLPLKYAKTTGGGACAPGCHQPRSYDRNNPGHTLELPKPSPSPSPMPKKGD